MMMTRSPSLTRWAAAPLIPIVPLPAGATKISLDFHDAAYGKGKTVTLVAIVLALLTLGAGVFLDRRRVV